MIKHYHITESKHYFVTPEQFHVKESQFKAFLTARDVHQRSGTNQPLHCVRYLIIYSSLFVSKAATRKRKRTIITYQICYGATFTSSFSPLFTFPFLSLALPIFFFCPSLPFLPE